MSEWQPPRCIHGHIMACSNECVGPAITDKVERAWQAERGE